MKSSKILWGFVLIVLGIFVGLKSMDIIDIDIFFEGWWTLFIIIPSFIGLFNRKDRMSSFIWLIVGIVLLLGCNDIITFENIRKLILPFILVVIGLSLMFKGSSNSKVSKEIENFETEDTICGVFKEEVRVIDKEFKSTEVEAIFGAVKLDISDAKIKKDILIEATSIFGQNKITVPKGYTVKVKDTAIFGEVINKTTDEDSKNIIYVNAFVMFGSVIIDDK